MSSNEEFNVHKENNGEDMTIANAQPSHAAPKSLSEVSANRLKDRTPGNAPLGTGLEARNIHAWFSKHLAVKDISLDFAAGTVTALIGPSGCGKSTFIVKW
jgi:phosphate transport system ATP-binding protein